MLREVILTTLMALSVSYETSYNRRLELRPQAMQSLHWMNPGWVLAFRLTDGVQQSAYDNFQDSSRDDDRPLARGFLPLDCLQVSGHCDRHYHSGLLNDWPSAYIDQVRMSVWKDGEEVAYVLFDGTGSTKENWFSKDRVINSSWMDLSDLSDGFFSIEGGWLSVQDQNFDHCTWGNLNSHDPYPAIFYSTTSNYTNFNNKNDTGVDRADVLTVEVKFRSFRPLVLQDVDVMRYCHDDY